MRFQAEVCDSTFWDYTAAFKEEEMIISFLSDGLNQDSRMLKFLKNAPEIDIRALQV